MRLHVIGEGNLALTKQFIAHAVSSGFHVIPRSELTHRSTSANRDAVADAIVCGIDQVPDYESVHVLLSELRYSGATRLVLLKDGFVDDVDTVLLPIVSILKTTHLDWTIILSDNGRSRQHDAHVVEPLSVKQTAKFILRQITDPSFLHQVVYVGG